jgi:hypothetical protein
MYERAYKSWLRRGWYLLRRRLYEAIRRDNAVKLYLDGFSVRLVAIEPVTVAGNALLYPPNKVVEKGPLSGRSRLSASVGAVNAR